MIKGSIQQEDITFTNVYAPNTGAPRFTEQMFNIRKQRSWHVIPSLHANKWRNRGNSG